MKQKSLEKALKIIVAILVLACAALTVLLVQKTNSVREVGPKIMGPNEVADYTYDYVSVPSSEVAYSISPEVMARIKESGHKPAFVGVDVTVQNSDSNTVKAVTEY
jgi:hypothetical protein